MQSKFFWVSVCALSLALLGQLIVHRPTMLVHVSRGEPPTSFQQVIEEAEYVVRAKVTSVSQGPDFIAPIEGQSDFHRVPTQLISITVLKAYKGNVTTNQNLVVVQDNTGITEAHPEPNGPLQKVFMRVEGDPLYKVGETYLLMLIHPRIPEEIKQLQPELWRDDPLIPYYPEGRLLINPDNTVRMATEIENNKVARMITGKSLAEIDDLIIAALQTNK